MSADVEELALGVLLPAFPGTTLAPAVAELLADGLGGVCLFGSNTEAGTEAVAELTAAIHQVSPTAVVAIDEEGGDVTRLHALTGSPVLGAAALGVADDLALTRSTGRQVAATLVAAGIDLDLAPIADVNSNPDNPVIGTRSFGTDPERVAAHVTAWIEGLQSRGVAACAKHFPGHGDTDEDSHVTLPVVTADLSTLWTRELVPFTAAVGAGVRAVMTSHLVVTSVDPERPATVSRPVLDLLRTRLDFTGAIVTDALDMAGVAGGRGTAEAAVQALLAGADLLCLGADTDVALVREVQAALVAAVDAGRVRPERLAEAATRVAALRATAAAPTAATTTDTRTGIADARRSLRVEGRLPDLSGAVMVVVDTPGTIAVGDVPWGLPAEIVRTPDSPGWPADLTPGRACVVQVRDAHRWPGVRTLLDDLSAGGRPLVVVEWGWPGPAPRGVPRICAHGWSQPGATAVRAVLREAGWDR